MIQLLELSGLISLNVYILESCLNKEMAAIPGHTLEMHHAIYTANTCKKQKNNNNNNKLK